MANHRLRFRLGSLVLGSLLWVGPAQAAIFVVDNIGDAVDALPGNGVCATAGAVCTLRAAIEEANSLAGADTINFNIAPGGPQTIVLGAALPPITTVVTINGTTQPGYGGTPIIEVNATSGGANTLSLNGATSSGSTIQGLVINRAPASAIRILGSSNNVIAGNFLGTNVAGTAALGNQVGVYIGGSATATNGNRIGGTLAADRNVISGNSQDGIQINGGTGGAANNLVEGNYIGVDVTGTLDLGNGSQGIAVFGGVGTNTNNVIGGTVAGAGNVISGNNNMGILIADSGTTGTLVQANRIGTNAAGTAGIGNGGAGVLFISPTANNTVGGTAVGADNLIAYNGQAGVQLTSTVGTGNAILRNAIHSNTDLGIDLRDDGVTVNDAGDGDTGANNLQNYPVLSAAMRNGAGSANFAGSLSSAASTLYRVEFFASSAADPSGFGEGQRYLGFTNVTTDASGNAVIGVTLATGLTAGELVTATATDPSNNTSEFSGALIAVGSLVVTTTADTADGTTTSVSALIAAPGADRRISLREAILATNATPGTDTIRFGIPLTDANHRYYRDDTVASSLTNVQVTTLAESAIADFDPDYPAGLARSWYRIQPSSVLPTLTDVVILDGSTQPGFLVGGPVVELDGAGAGASSGLQVTGGNSTIRGFVVHSFQVEGIVLGTGDSNTLAGNYAGTDVSGKLDRGNGDNGIDVGAGSANNVIGGTTIADRNLLSGNTGAGIALGGALTIGNVVLGNYIGTDVTGTASLGNSGPGVAINASSGSNTIGGSAAGSGNLIAFNNQDGVRLAPTAGSGVSILGNSIFANGENGIDLNNDGVTGNDPGDADVGPNSLLNFPDNTAALESGGTLTVYFSLDLASASYRIEFFKNPSGADASGNGEGQIFASSVNITHPGGGSLNFNHSLAGAVGDVVTTTTTVCTDGATCAGFGDTSEFGNALIAVPAAPLSISSAANQSFVVGAAPTVSAFITITEDAAVPTITAANDIRIVIPSGFPMRWDPSASSVTLGGSASFRVSPLVQAFEDFGRSVVLDVASNFAPGETLTVTGLRFFSFTSPAPPDSLELEVENNDLTSAIDDKIIQIFPDSFPNLSSDDDQIFVLGSAPVPIIPLTVSEGTTASITALNDIRIRIPSSFDMTWDPSDLSAFITGPAASKVGSSVSYEDTDKTLVIDVVASFVTGDFITVSGLSFANFLNPELPANLELEVDDAGSVIDLDDKRIQIDDATDVPFFTATATDSQVKLEWVYPDAGDCDFVRILVREDGVFPGPLEGFPARLVANVPCGAPGAKDSVPDPSLLNDIAYSYSAYVDHGGLFTPGKFVRSRPFDTSLNLKWAYATGATSMAPPGLRIKIPDSFVYAVSNDSILHSMRGGAAGGDWPSSWKPNHLGAPAQARPAVVSFTVGASSNGAAFLGSQDGHVHAVRADTGSTEWKQPIASMVQAAPAGNFLAFNPAAFDLILVGTRNVSAPNALKALDVHTGNPAWSFVNSSLQGGDDKDIGIISSGAAIDYLNHLVYFASRERSGGSNKTLWCVNFDGVSANLVWASALGNIDGSPILFNGRIYVGTNAGIVRALDALNGDPKWSLPLGDGAIKGFLFPQFGTSNLIASTTNKVWSIADNVGSGAVNPGWPVSVIPSPSIPLFVPGTMKVLVGSGNGNLYQMDAVNPLPATSVMLGDGGAAVGAPTMDVLKSMIYVGTDAGVIYGVVFPLP